LHFSGSEVFDQILCIKNICKNGFPYHRGLQQTPWGHDFIKLDPAQYQEAFMSGSVFLEKIFKDIFQCKHEKMIFPIVVHPIPGNHDFNKLEFALSESFQVNLSFSGPVVLENFFIIIHLIFAIL
jgi:hypothetical protein